MFEKLTSREHAVMLLLAEGFNNKTIAEKLHLSEKSIKNNINSIFHKFRIDSSKKDSRVEAVLVFLHMLFAA